MKKKKIKKKKKTVTKYLTTAQQFMYFNLAPQTKTRRQ